MIRLIFIIPILLSCANSNKEFSSIKTTDTNGFSIPISWFNELKGDFSFTNNWEYADGIELNDYQQIICWKCPPRAQKILDKRRKVPTDSLAVFYSLIDSTRHYSKDMAILLWKVLLKAETVSIAVFSFE